ncbi:MAG: acetylxylan esterase [Clostridia bacterium]|nr:acetylxylan esterase [Clostridia bacterium]
MREQKTINGELVHDLLIEKMLPALSYNENVDYAEWKESIREKFIELTGIDEIEKNACPLNVQVEWREKKEGYELIRFTFDSEVGATVPCYLLVPDTGKEKYPVAITLQGHSSGFHNSIAEPKNESEEEYALGRGKFAVQAVENGFIALAVEQRGMGERRPTTPERFTGANCRWAARLAFELGRTLIGERVWDVRKAIDALAAFPECDTDKILITGNSGGGTASYYAACYDERIKLSVPSCSFCSYKESILSVAHCDCNYIPSVYKYFDMQDLACLIAPRPLTVVTGIKDKIFPIHGVRRSYETVRQIYARNDAQDNCRIIETPMAHYWCVDLVWNAINEACEKLGWK